MLTKLMKNNIALFFSVNADQLVPVFMTDWEKSEVKPEPGKCNRKLKGPLLCPGSDSSRPTKRQGSLLNWVVKKDKK